MFDDVLVAILILIGLTILVLAPNIKIVRDEEVSIVERLGRYLKTLQGPGIFFIVPIIDRTIETIYLGKKIHKETIILEDETHITYQIDYYIRDPKAYCYITLNAEKDFKKDIHQLFMAEKDEPMTLEMLNEYAEPYGIEITDYVIM